MRKRLISVSVAAAVCLAVPACATREAATPKVLAADAWVRTTEGAKRPDMTAVFVNLTNPSDEDRVLVGADCGDVAKSTELHEMVKRDGQMVMQEAKDGIKIPARGHEHLAPGGPHIMLMGLNRQLPAGSEELACTLTLDDEQRIEITAPVKQFTEEQDTYHTHAPSASG